MTGSGKTGLGIGLLEEAAMDNIPVIAIDPKGDLGNLMLSFPGFKSADFRPWINEQQAINDGKTPDEYAAAQAALWKNGLDSWGQKPARVKTFQSKCDVSIYTPGSDAGQPVSLLQQFDAPAAAVREDSDLYRERVQATATSLLSLLGIDADPISSREHILLSSIFDHAWQEEQSLSIADLIGAIQSPPFTKIGVMDLESFYSSRDRFALAMRLNNLLAAPGFDVWMRGEPLNTAGLLHTEEGKPRISVMSIAHLDDNERMFFVAMLLNDIIAWMRAQRGTSSLRAILYMDEVFGYMPPTANPPSKRLLLTMLKQARAYGLGLVLATQNPVDLDYKGLSNTGTWFIGRLQTERDKARVMEGLEGVSQGGEFDRQAMEKTLAGLGKRRFLLHNVHEDAPVVFGTRWVMSYLAGPLTRDQIRSLMHDRRKPAAEETPPATRAATRSGDAPLLPPGVEQVYVYTADEGLTHIPKLIAIAGMTFSNARYDVHAERQRIYTVDFADGPVTVSWDEAEVLELSRDDLDNKPNIGARYADVPAAASKAKNYTAWQRQFKSWVRQAEPITIYRSKKYRLNSEVGETEGEFRVRVQALASEKRDLAASKLRKRYNSKFTTLENRLLRAQQAIERESQQATKKHLDTAVSIGSAILGAVLGRKRISATSTRRISTAIRGASGSRKEAGDVARAKQTARKVQQDIKALEAALQKDLAELDDVYDAQQEELAEIVIKAKASDINVPLLCLAWMPYRETESTGEDRLEPAWIEN